jgi:hypothetical protein
VENSCQGQAVEEEEDKDERKANISEHIKNVFDESELSPEATVRDFRTVRIEGARSVARTVQQYNLDLILSLGYRVKSKVATQFRIWANDVLKRYVVEGVATNEARRREIGTMVQLLERSSDDTVAGIAEVLRKYTPEATAGERSGSW